jgi:hypothetical protein
VSEPRRLGDLFQSASEIPPGAQRGDWGPWRLDPAVLVLYLEPHHAYEVDLERCTTSAEVLDWVCQVAAKTWADDATLAGLVRALDDVLAPQAHLCSSGQPKTLGLDSIGELVRRAADQ